MHGIGGDPAAIRLSDSSGYKEPTNLGSRLSRAVPVASLVVGASGLVWLIEKVFLV